MGIKILFLMLTLIVPLIIRFSFIQAAISKSKAAWTTFVFGVILITIMTLIFKELTTMDYILTYIVFMINYSILISGQNEKDEK